MAKGNSMAYKIGVVLVVAALLITAVVIKQRAGEAPASASDLPTLVDLGMGKCKACQDMQPILEELARDYEGRALVQIIDIGDQPEAIDHYRVQTIPTQVFLDADGNEVFRHVGFMPREDIVAKLREMGVQ